MVAQRAMGDGAQPKGCHAERKSGDVPDWVMKVHRVDHHIRDLDAKITAFLAPGPYELVTMRSRGRQGPTVAEPDTRRARRRRVVVEARFGGRHDSPTVGCASTLNTWSVVHPVALASS